MNETRWGQSLEEHTVQYLQLLLAHLHLLLLVPDGLHAPASVVSPQVVKLHVAETILQLLKGVKKLMHTQVSVT